MLTASCHCGAVRVEVPGMPESVTNCNCSICRRYGVLWAYYKDADTRLIAEPGATEDYACNQRTQVFIRCKACGCVMQWKEIAPDADSWAGVNARTIDAVTAGDVKIRLLDGATTWDYVG